MQSRLKQSGWLNAYEIMLCAIIGILLSADVLLLYTKDIRIDFAGYSTLTGSAVILVLVGVFYRRCRNEKSIAETLIGAGLFVLFTQVGAVFNYMFLPLQYPLIDKSLMQFDSVLGYVWADAVNAVAGMPWLGTILFHVYFTSLAQLVLMLLILGISGQSFKLYHFLFTGVFGALMCVVFWIFFPSFGPSTLYTLPQQTLDSMPMAASPIYGAELLRLGKEGVDFITPAHILGLIGFPSFHTIMALMSVVFAYGNRKIFIPMVCLNLVMIPAILVQGGHHLADVLVAPFVFWVAYKSAEKILKCIAHQNRVCHESQKAGTAHV